MNSDIQKLADKIVKASLPNDLSEKLAQIITRLEKISESVNFLAEYDHAARYIDWIISLPWNKKTEDILDLGHALQTLNKYHYGLGELKDRILEYLSVMILNQSKL